MDRRDALKGLATLAGAGMTVTPVTTKDAERVTLILIKPGRILSHEETSRFRQQWENAMQGTDLEGVRAVVLPDGADVEFVRK